MGENTSGNGLVSKLIREGDKGIKTEFERLLNGESIEAKIDEQIVFSQLTGNRNAIWSLLLASGYLKVVNVVFSSAGKPTYQLALTNYEVKCMFETMIEGWFAQTEDFGEFISAMFKGDVKSMNRYMNKVALNTFSYFDAGNKPSEQREPERFYHGFVLGLIVDRSEYYMAISLSVPCFANALNPRSCLICSTAWFLASGASAVMILFPSFWSEIFMAFM